MLDALAGLDPQVRDMSAGMTTLGGGNGSSTPAVALAGPRIVLSYLSVLTASLALKSVNILAVQVHTTEAGAVDDFLVDAPDAMTEADLRAAVERGRGRDAWVVPAAAQGLVDPPTRALGLAGRLIRDPDALGDTLRALLDADTVTWRPAPSPVPRTAGGF